MKYSKYSLKIYSFQEKGRDIKEKSSRLDILQNKRTNNQRK